MATKNIHLIITYIMIILNQVVSHPHTVNGRIKLTIGTTAGCGDTVKFINNQLYEAYQMYGKWMDLEFVPWGRTKWDEGDITCQFRNNDCWANRLHRCVLNQLKGRSDAQMRYMKCEFSARWAYKDRSYDCAIADGTINMQDLEQCVENSGDYLDKDARFAAEKPIEILNFVPYVVFNDKISYHNHKIALNRLSNVICKALRKDPSNSINKC